MNDQVTRLDVRRHRRAATGAWTAAAPASGGGRKFVIGVTLLAGAFMLGAGIWSLVAPHSFANAVNFPFAEHLLHDLGAFQIGIGATLLLAVVWIDGPALALAGFLVGNTIHAVIHAVDLHLGGHASDPWLLGAASLLAAAALAVRLRELGYVVGAVGTAAAPELVPFVHQKTALLTTYRRDGTPVGTPLSAAVDGDRLFIRSYEAAWKTKRIRNRPEVQIAPSTARGKPTGAAIRLHARRLEGAEARYAARLLRRKHPLLHGVIVPLSHRLGRSKLGRTVHYQLTPLAD